MLAIAAVASLYGIAAAQAAPGAAFSAPRELSKTVLADTSIDGPAFTEIAFKMGTAPRGVIAWTGTDAIHHLNIMSTSDGVHFTNKVVLHEASFVRPAVMQMSEAAGGQVVLAWTGTDPAHSLNVLWDAYGSSPKKITLDEQSFTAPSIEGFGGKLLLAWAGVDVNHSLNVLPITPGTLALGTKTVLPQFSSLSRPDLTIVSSGSTQKVLITWITRSFNLDFASSSDGVNFVPPLPTASPETSSVGSDMEFVPDTTMPQYWWAWTGQDRASSVNVQYTVTYPNWPPAGTKATLAESALGGPTMAFFGVSRQILVFWTGVDPAHHLNAAIIAV